MEGILVATAAPPENIHFVRLGALSAFRTAMNGKKLMNCRYASRAAKRCFKNRPMDS
jgi:hypothetical protein